MDGQDLGVIPSMVLFIQNGMFCAKNLLATPFAFVNDGLLDVFYKQGASFLQVVKALNSM